MPLVSPVSPVSLVSLTRYYYTESTLVLYPIPIQNTLSTMHYAPSVPSVPSVPHTLLLHRIHFGPILYTYTEYTIHYALRSIVVV